MTEFFEMLIVALGGFGVVVAALAWLGRSLITHLLSKDLENHKNRIETLYQQNMDAYRHELEKIQIEHEVRFTALHQKRMDVIAEFYALLLELSEISKLMSLSGLFPMPERPRYQAQLVDALKKGLDKLESVKHYFDKNRLYFSGDLADKVDQFIDAIHGPIERANSALKQDYSEAIQELQSLPPISEAIFSLRRNIEGEFRRLIGS